MEARDGDYGLSDGRWLEVDWGSKIERIEVDSELGVSEVEYVSLGEGPTIVLVHGLAGSWRNWLENIPRLSDRHRVVALDLPGFGDSPLPERPITMPGYGSMLVNLADRLGLPEETILVGHSMGGVVVTEALLAAPGRFSGASLVAAAGTAFARTSKSRKRVAQAIIALNRLPAPERTGRGLSRPRLRAASLGSFIAHPNEIDPEILWELVTYGARAPGTLQAAYALSGFDGRSRLGEIDLPVLLLWGARDLLVPLRAAYSYRKRLPESELVVLNDTGHMVQIERPARFDWEIEEFAREVIGVDSPVQPVLEPPDGR